MNMLSGINYTLLIYVKLAFTFLFLTIFSIYDIKFRDIPDKLVWIVLALSIALFTLSTPFYLDKYGASLFGLYMILSTVIVMAYGLMYLSGLMGLGDVFVMIIFLFLYPLIDIYDLVIWKLQIPYHLPPIVPIALYSAFWGLILGLLKSLIYSIKHRDKIPRDISLSKKILLVLSGRPVKVSEYLRMKHYYPLTIYEVVDGKLVEKYRVSFKAEEEEPVDHQAELRKLVEQGYLSLDKYIWVTYGIPYIAPLTIGFTTFILVGDTPLILLFT